jgi:hypothetical protein
MTGLFIGMQVNAEENVLWNRNANNCQLNTGNRPADEDNKDDHENLILEDRSKSNFVVYPNPAIDEISIDYVIGKNTSDQINFTLYDMNGRKIMTRLINDQLRGSQTMRWQIESLESGMYFLSMEVDDVILQREKVTIIR